MANIAHGINEDQNKALFRKAANNDDVKSSEAPPWLQVQPGQMPPMMLQVRLRNGVHESFPYGDIRRIRCRDAGAIQLETFSSPRTIVTIEGRHLRELSTLLGNGVVQWIEETDDRDVDRCESLPTITSIVIDHYTAQ